MRGVWYVIKGTVGAFSCPMCGYPCDTGESAYECLELGQVYCSSSCAQQDAERRKLASQKKGRVSYGPR